MNPEHLLAPRLARSLPEASKERALARLAQRQLWHVVFDPCPRLLQSFPPDGWPILEPFLEHAAQARLSMRWSLHGQLLQWLARRRPEALDAGSIEELLAAMAGRWANADQTATPGFLLHAPALMPESAVAVWKGSSAAESHRRVVVRLPEQSLPKTAVYFAALAERRYPDQPDWRPIPD